MEFNPDKYEVIRVSRNKNPITYPYKLYNIELKTIEDVKYLGITINQYFNWKPHTDTLSSKAPNSLKLVTLNVQTNNQKIKETTYNTYVRPQLECCAPVWHSWQKILACKIERIQRAAARYILSDYDFTSSVTEMLQILNWQTLEHRRVQNSLIMMFKIRFNLVAVDTII